MITAAERRQTPSALYFFIPQFLPPLEQPLPPPFFFFVIWSQMKFHCFSCEASESLAETEEGSATAQAFPRLARPEKSREQRGRRAQWRFGGSPRRCRIPQIRLRAQRSEREWDGHLGSFPVFLWWLLASLSLSALFCFFAEAKVNMMWRCGQTVVFMLACYSRSQSVCTQDNSDSNLKRTFSLLILSIQLHSLPWTVLISDILISDILISDILSCDNSCLSCSAPMSESRGGCRRRWHVWASGQTCSGRSHTQVCVSVALLCLSAVICQTLLF